jgi:hypothetical protein
MYKEDELTEETEESSSGQAEPRAIERLDLVERRYSTARSTRAVAALRAS